MRPGDVERYRLQLWGKGTLVLVSSEKTAAVPSRSDKKQAVPEGRGELPSSGKPRRCRKVCRYSKGEKGGLKREPDLGSIQGSASCGEKNRHVVEGFTSL